MSPLNLISFPNANRTVLHAVLLSALLVVLLRLFAPFEIAKNQALQQEAAQRLAAGLGLTVAYDKGGAPDISQPSRTKYLTYWPPGYSLVVGGFLALGVPLSLSLRVIFAVVTAIGWIGWGIIAAHCLAKPLFWRNRPWPLHLVLAVLLPIFLTPWWGGTDVFLWAGVPFVLLLLVKSAEGEMSYSRIGLAGLIFGFTCAMRYASLFLGLGALLILLQLSWGKWASWLKNSVVFGVSSLALILPTLGYAKLFSGHGSSPPGYIHALPAPANFVNSAIQACDALVATSNMLTGSPLLELISGKLGSSAARTVGIICLGAVMVLPVILVRNRGGRFSRKQHDFSLSLALLLPALAVFQLAAAFTPYCGQLGARDPRYYVPLSLGGLLISFDVISARSMGRFFKLAFSSCFVIFVTYYCVLMPAGAAIDSKWRRELTETILAYTPANTTAPCTSANVDYPSGRLFTRKENSRLKIRELLDAHPDAIFLVFENYSLFVYDSLDPRLEPGRNIKQVPVSKSPYWEQAYTSKPLKAFWIQDYPSAASNIEDLSVLAVSSRRLVFEDLLEKTRIWQSDLPAGFRFSSDPKSAGQSGQAMAR